MQPFENIKVIDLTQIIAGPMATYLLGLQGADIIKVERPGEADIARRMGIDPAMNAQGMGSHFLAVGANKRCMTVDLKQARGVELVKRLAADAQVFVESHRPGAMKELGLAYDDLKSINESIIYCSISGYGQQPFGDRNRAYDNMIQAASGMMYASPNEGGVPRTCGILAIDVGAAYTAAYAIAAALHRRAVTGEGAYIDCSMLDTAMSLMSTQVTAATIAEHHKGLKRWNLPTGIGTYDTADGWIMIGALTPRQRRQFWPLVGLPADFDRAMGESVPDADAHVKAALLRLPAQSWEAQFRGAGIPAEAVRTLAEGMRLSESSGRDIAQPFDIEIDGESRRAAAITSGFSIAGCPHAFNGPPAREGQHTDTILHELGLDSNAVDLLRREKIIA